MLTRADLRDSDKHCGYVPRPLTMLNKEYLVSTRFVLTFLLYLACHGRGARQPKAAAMLAELFVASIGQVPKGFYLTTMVPTADVERTRVLNCVRAWRTAGQVSTSMALRRCFARWGPRAKRTSWANSESVATKPKMMGFRLQPSLCLCWGWQVWSTIGSLDLGSK